MASSYSDYLVTTLAAVAKQHKTLTGHAQLMNSISNLPVTVVAAYAEGVVLKFAGGGNTFVCYVSLAKLSLDGF